MNPKIYVQILTLVLCLAGCATGSKLSRVTIDASTRDKSIPDWVSNSKVSWEQDNSIKFKSTYTVSGSQRINGCFDLGKLELKESLLSEIKQEIDAELNLASEGISEGTDALLTKSLSLNLQGKIQGLRIKEQFYERYVVNEIERIDCHVLAEMTKTDFQKLRNAMMSSISSVSPEVAAVVRKRQSNFFSKGQSSETAASRDLPPTGDQ